MATDDIDDVPDPIVERAAEFDEALAAGLGHAALDDSGLCPDLGRRLRRVIACIELLDRARSPRRPSGPRGPTGQGPSLRLPGFEILGEVGRGGMGVVYKARQISLDRLVALKFLPPALADDPVRLLRFRNEAAIAARLTDSRILPVFDILEGGGVPVLVMPFVEGRDLARILAERKAATEAPRPSGRRRDAHADREYLESVLPLLDQVVAAVAALHQAGVIHRDIKPSNILVDARGDVRLTDFGLARLGQSPQMTAPGAAMGTPGFMSPEQWDGREDVDFRADVFGLGATLYQVLTLALPYGLARPGKDAPPARRPRASQPALPAGLDAVILKALEPDRRDRYASADVLREDWRQVRAGRPPRFAGRAGPSLRLSRWARRRPWMATNLVALAVLAGALALTLADRRAAALPDPGGARRTPDARAARTTTVIPDRSRAVRVETDPPGARFVLVLLGEGDGEPDSRRRIDPPAGARTPARVAAPPGDYLVVVEWPDGRFHEVYRHVPAPGESAGVYRHLRWQEHSGVIELPPIEAPPQDVLGRMAYFGGSPAYAVGAGPAPSASFPARDVPAYYLDQFEVSIRDYLGVAPGVPAAFGGHAPGPDGAVRYVSFDEATHYIEKMGKRLPTEAEYELAATGGGTRPFPGGEPDIYLLEHTWPFGPVGSPGYDRTATRPPVFGLYSNVAEWTSSWFVLAPRLAGVALPGDPARLRVIRGGPPSVVRGEPDPDEFQLGPRYRVGHPRSNAWPPGVGFRGARSARPRFLAGGAPAELH
jgi:eukaryotic-like serine/threonine-protein kinase